jgi:integrase
LALTSGLRLREFSYLLVYEVPALPARPGRFPVPLAVPAGVAKGRKHRTTWVEPEALESVHRYIDLDRAAGVVGSSWRPARGWGEPLEISDPDPLGGRVNGRRVRWEGLSAGQRRRLVAPGGGSPVLAVRADGGPFTAWDSVFARASERIRERFEPRFPHVHPHRLRHTFAIRTLERLVGGYYEQAAALVAATGTRSGADAALSLYLAKADPMMVLRDLLGHTSVMTTEAYLRRLDMTRVYADAYERSGLADAAARREADEEFGEDPVEELAARGEGSVGAGGGGG